MQAASFYSSMPLPIENLIPRGRRRCPGGEGEPLMIILALQDARSRRLGHAFGPFQSVLLFRQTSDTVALVWLARIPLAVGNHRQRHVQVDVQPRPNQERGPNSFSDQIRRFEVVSVVGWWMENCFNGQFTVHRIHLEVCPFGHVSC